MYLFSAEKSKSRLLPNSKLEALDKAIRELKDKSERLKEERKSNSSRELSNKGDVITDILSKLTVLIDEYNNLKEPNEPWIRNYYDFALQSKILFTCFNSEMIKDIEVCFKHRFNISQGWSVITYMTTGRVQAPESAQLILNIGDVIRGDVIPKLQAFDAKRNDSDHDVKYIICNSRAEFESIKDESLEWCIYVYPIDDTTFGVVVIRKKNEVSNEIVYEYGMINRESLVSYSEASQDVKYNTIQQVKLYFALKSFSYEDYEGWKEEFEPSYTSHLH